jgi:NitT/TauT family transport system ATP-binding protein
MMGLLVLLGAHKGEEDVALLADDLDLEIDEIFPSLEYSEVLGLIRVKDGRAAFTDLGKRFAAASIRDRKAMLRDQLKRTALFRTLLKALEQAPGHRLTDEEFGRLVSFTSAAGEDAVQNIVNWGRYADLLRYDADRHELIAVRRAAAPRGGSGRSPPPSSTEPAGPNDPRGADTSSTGPLGSLPLQPTPA